MRTTISIEHSTYMMTIGEVIEVIEALTVGKVIRLSEVDGKLTFTIETIEPDPVGELSQGEDDALQSGDEAENSFVDKMRRIGLVD